MSNQINADQPKKQRGSKAHRPFIFAGVAAVLALLVAPLTVSGVDAASTPKFCIKSTGFDGEFTSHAGGTLCQTSDAPAPAPAPSTPAPLPPIDLAALNVQCTTTGGPMSTSANFSWAAIPNAVAYRVSLRDGSGAWMAAGAPSQTGTSFLLTPSLASATLPTTTQAVSVGVSYIAADGRTSETVVMRTMKRGLVTGLIFDINCG